MEKLSIHQIGQSLLSNKQFIQKLQQELKEEKTSPTKNKAALGTLIQEIKQLLYDLIHHQLENELKEIIQDNNKILNQIKGSMHKTHKEVPLHDFAQDMSFSQVHRIMDEERNKLKLPQDVNDASLQRSVSAFVQLKVQTIEEKIVTIDKRLRSMEEKYETNLKSIWNVLSITESAIFDHLKEQKEEKKQSRLDKSTAQSEGESEKKSFFGGIFKMGK